MPEIVIEKMGFDIMNSPSPDTLRSASPGGKIARTKYFDAAFRSMMIRS
jgi:hypothetical protein